MLRGRRDETADLDSAAQMKKSLILKAYKTILGKAIDKVSTPCYITIIEINPSSSAGLFKWISFDKSIG